MLSLPFGLSSAPVSVSRLLALSLMSLASFSLLANAEAQNVLPVAPTAPLIAPSSLTTSSIAPLTAPLAADADMNAFIAQLMKKMTLQEKLGQLNQLSGEGDVTGPNPASDYIAAIKAGNVGSMLNVFTVKYTKKLQRLAVEHTRLGIPLLFGYDVIHGHRTIFPISLGESASWDLPAIELSARIAASEASAEGIHWTFAPMVDIARDPRWGRMSEGAGEDVYLGGEIAKARIKGFQGDDLSAPNTILATAKHFAVYGLAQAGRDYHSTDVSDVELWNTYLPPFKASVDAGVATFMSSFNDLNGIPATGNHYLLTDVLKNQWQFKGFVVSDYTAINELIPHGFAQNDNHAAELAMNAGLDMDMVGQLYVTQIKQLLRDGKVSEAQINDAVRRVLEMKYRLGLFTDPYRYCNETRQAEEIYKPEYLQAARTMAQKSIVLLKNAKQMLPLSKQLGSIAVIGPLANSKHDMQGSWHAAGNWDKPSTLLEGIKAKLGATTTINYAKGASYAIEVDSSDIQNAEIKNVEVNTSAAKDSDAASALSTRAGEFAEAIAAAQKSEVIVVAMGEAGNMSGEAKSRSNIDLPGNQQALLRELKKLNKPMVLVLMNGRPLAITWEDDNMDAILETWFAGTMGGDAIADVLFGDYNPSGKLPVTFPRNVGQIPIYYNMKNTGRPYVKGGEYTSHYLDIANDPLYPFGYGLSYTQFEYSALSLSTHKLTANGKLVASVKVSNTGNYDGRETVQLYIRDLVGSITRPVKELKAFKQIDLKKGESKIVEFELTAKDLAFYNRNLALAAEAGDFKLLVGGDSVTLLETEFSLTDNVAF